MYIDFMAWMTISYNLIMKSQVPIHLGNLKGSFRDFFVDVRDGHAGGAHVQFSHFIYCISDQLDQPNPKTKAFYHLLDEERESLSKGCDSVSCLEATTTLLHIKSGRNIYGLVFDDMCAAFKGCLSNDNKLPWSFDAT